MIHPNKTFQDASHEYLLARQRMNEKVNRCKDIELKMEETLRQIQAAYAEQGDNVAKTVGTLHLEIVEVQGHIVDGAVIKVFVEPESFPDFEELSENEENEPKKNVVEWSNRGAFPAMFVFHAIQSREAMVRIAVVEKSSHDEDDGEPPIKEITFPIANLFRNDMDSWYSFDLDTFEKAEEIQAKAEEEDVIETEAGEASSDKAGNITKETEVVVDEAMENAAGVDTAIATLSADAEEVVEEDELVRATAESDAVQESKHDVTDDVQATDTAEETAEETAVAEKTEHSTVEEIETKTAVEENGSAIKNHEAYQDTKEDVVEETKESASPHPHRRRMHLKASFVLSEMEALAQKAFALSKEKNEMDMDIRMCDQELSAARLRYERLKASQKATSPSSNSSALKSRLLSSTLRAPPKPKVCEVRINSIQLLYFLLFLYLCVYDLYKHVLCICAR